MIRNWLRFLSLVTILLLSGFTLPPQALAADQAPGDNHWTDELTVSGFDSPVTILLKDRQGNIYAGGEFTAFGGMGMSHIAKWDGKTWSGLGDGLKDRVNTLAVDSRGYLYTDVLVTHDGSLPETVVMRWDGSAWSALEGDLSSLVDTLAAGRDSNIIINDLAVDSHDQLYAGGYFYLIQSDRYVGYVARWDGSDWALLGNGMNHTVYELAIDGQDNLYAGGEFTSASGIPASRIAKWDGAAWSALGSGLGGDAPTVADMEADKNGNLYVTGQFATAGGIPIQLIAMWDGASWKDLAPQNNNSGEDGLLPTIFDLYVSENGDLYVGGSFATIDGVAANNIARWDGSTWSALSSANGNGVNERVLAIMVDENELVFTGGYFTTAGGLPANHIARWDGSTWSTWSERDEAGVNNVVSALAVDPNGILYAGGYFSSAGMIPANHIARWDGAEWSALADGVDAAVQALALDGSSALYAGGDFTTAGDVAVNYIARWDGDSWSALGEGIGAGDRVPQVQALAVDGRDNLYAGGDFSLAGGIVANYIARWDGSAWSALGGGLDDQVLDLAVDPQGNLYAAGWFRRAGDVEANGIARWDGSSWSALGSGAGQVEAIAIDQQGNLYAAGMFYIPPDSSTLTYIARWDGSTWSPLGSGVDNSVHALAVDQEGNLYAGGDFMSAGEAPVRRVARWDGITWNPLGSGIGAAGDYSYIVSLLVDDRGNLYVGGQFTLAGNKPSAYLGKWCAEPETGSCAFSFISSAGIQGTSSAPTAPVEQSSETQTISTAEPEMTPTPKSPDNPINEYVKTAVDVYYLIGGGVVMVVLIGGLLLIRSRKT